MLSLSTLGSVTNGIVTLTSALSVSPSACRITGIPTILSCLFFGSGIFVVKKLYLNLNYSGDSAL